MSKRATMLMLAVVACLFGCSGVQVNQDYRPGTDFSRLKSYSFQESQPLSEDPRVTNPLLHERFRSAIDHNLAIRGFHPGLQVDFIVQYDYSISTRIESDPMDTHVGIGYGRSYRYGGVGFGSGTSVRQYEVGTLVIDFIEPESDRLLWRGTGTQRLSTNPTPEKNIEFANSLVREILSQFPPPLSHQAEVIQ